VTKDFLKFFSLCMILLLGACGGQETTASVTTTTPTQEIKTRFVPPTPDTSENISAVGAEILGLKELRTFPESIVTGVEPLSQELAASIWSSFLAGARVIAGTETIVDFCEDGSGIWVAAEMTQKRYEGEVFDWHIKHGFADRWNQPRLQFEFRNVEPRGSDDNPNFSTELRAPQADGELRWRHFGGTTSGTLNLVDHIAVYTTDYCSY
jgi:hypothetical protein